MQTYAKTREPLVAPVNTTRSTAQVDNEGHIRGVNASGRRIAISTAKAGAIAAAILAVFYLPAEYGVDPTGLGGVLGLTEMGEIKQQLYAEEAADKAAAAGGGAALPEALLQRLDGIEAQLASIGAVYGVDTLPPPHEAVALPSEGEVAPVTAQTSPSVAPEIAARPAPTPEPVAATPVDAGWRDEASYTLPPGEGIEVKLAMNEGETATFEWTANGSVVNYDTHGDGGGQNVSYEKGRGVGEQTGELVAAFTGNHGWFWRNRTDDPVTITVRTAGEYAAMKRP